METETKTLKAVGFNNEQTECDACGRMELRGTVVVADEDGAEVGRYGTTCASRLLAVKVTRSSALSAELSRRNTVVKQIQLARKELAAGRLDWVGMYVAELDRFWTLHRADELAAVAELRQAVA